MKTYKKKKTKKGGGKENSWKKLKLTPYTQSNIDIKLTKIDKKTQKTQLRKVRPEEYLGLKYGPHPVSVYNKPHVDASLLKDYFVEPDFVTPFQRLCYTSFMIPKIKAIVKKSFISLRDIQIMLLGEYHYSGKISMCPTILDACNHFIGNINADKHIEPINVFVEVTPERLKQIKINSLPKSDTLSEQTSLLFDDHDTLYQTAKLFYLANINVDWIDVNITNNVLSEDDTRTCDEINGNVYKQKPDIHGLYDFSKVDPTTKYYTPPIRLKKWIHDVIDCIHNSVSFTAEIKRHIPNKISLLKLLTENCIIIKEIERANIIFESFNLAFCTEAIRSDINFDTDEFANEEEFNTYVFLVQRKTVDVYTLARILSKYYDYKRILVHAGELHIDFLIKLIKDFDGLGKADIHTVDSDGCNDLDESHLQGVQLVMNPTN